MLVSFLSINKAKTKIIIILCKNWLVCPLYQYMFWLTILYKPCLLKKRPTSACSLIQGAKAWSRFWCLCSTKPAITLSLLVPICQECEQAAEDCEGVQWDCWQSTAWSFSPLQDKIPKGSQVFSGWLEASTLQLLPSGCRLAQPKCKTHTVVLHYLPLFDSLGSDHLNQVWKCSMLIIFYFSIMQFWSARGIGSVYQKGGHWS